MPDRFESRVTFLIDNEVKVLCRLDRDIPTSFADHFISFVLNGFILIELYISLF